MDSTSGLYLFCWGHSFNWLERQTVNLNVGGSNPPVPATTWQGNNAVVTNVVNRNHEEHLAKWKQPRRPRDQRTHINPDEFPCVGWEGP